LEAERAKQPALPFFTICSQIGLKRESVSSPAYLMDQRKRRAWKIGQKRAGKGENGEIDELICIIRAYLNKYIHIMFTIQQPEILCGRKYYTMYSVQYFH